MIATDFFTKTEMLKIKKLGSALVDKENAN